LVIKKKLYVRSERGCCFEATLNLFAEDVLMAKLKVGDRVKIPVHSVFHQEAGHFGKVVYISEDGETVTVKCDRKHNGKTVAFNIALESISE
jgi:hypothetical protein